MPTSSKILVTGASGFIGRHLVSALVRSGCSVRAATRRPEAIPIGPSVEPVAFGDLTRPIDWTPFLQGVETVVHLAGIAHQTLRSTSRALYRRVNCDATEELAEQAARAGIRRLVFISSISAQADFATDETLTEQGETQPLGNYGVSKRDAEAAVRASNVEHTILRPAVVYGPGVKGNIARLLQVADTPWPLPFAAFDNRRSLLAIDNLIAAVVFALREPGARNQTYVVADPTALTLTEILRVLRTALGRPCRLFALPPQALRAALTLSGHRDAWLRIGGSLVVDPVKLRSAGWRPVVDTPAGLGQMVLATSLRPS